MNQLEENYSGDLENFLIVVVGCYCVVWYNEGGWYRVKVEQVQGREVRVYYIDYGDCVIVLISSIRIMDFVFFKLFV